MSARKFLQSSILLLVFPFITYAASERVRLSHRACVQRDHPRAQELNKTPGEPVNFEKFISQTVEMPALSKRAAVDSRAEGKAEEAARPNDNSSISRKVNLSIPAPPLFGSSSRQLTLIDKTYLDAYAILQKSNSCSQFFGGPRIATVILNSLHPRLEQATLEETHVAINMFGAITFSTDSQTGISYRLFRQVLVNLRGPFYQSVNHRSQALFNRIGHYPANTREARVTMLLHELGHLLSGSDGRWLLPDDGGNRIQIAANTNTIMSKCSEQIESLGISGHHKSD